MTTGATMRVLMFVALVAGCGGMPQAGSPDMMPTADLMPSPDLTPAVEGPPAPAGFGTACTSSSDCRGFVSDRAPGFLGCGAYLGASYCTMPCGASAAGAGCWQGSTCSCVNRVNAGGLPETDCYCARL